MVTKRLLASMASRGTPPDFVLCIGDDKSDEDMFESIADAVVAPSAEVFACTVGRKPSKAKYYLEDIGDVIYMLHGLAKASQQPLQRSLSRVSYANDESDR